MHVNISLFESNIASSLISSCKLVCFPFMVTEPLEIVSRPQNLTIEEGTNVILSCNVSSSLPVKITWEKEGSEGNVLADGSILSVKNVSRSDAGTYRCKAENGIAIPATASATINVLCKFLSPISICKQI